MTTDVFHGCVINICPKDNTQAMYGHWLWTLPTIQCTSVYCNFNDELHDIWRRTVWLKNVFHTHTHRHTHAPKPSNKRTCMNDRHIKYTGYRERALVISILLKPRMSYVRLSRIYILYKSSPIGLFLARDLTVKWNLWITHFVTCGIICHRLTWMTLMCCNIPNYKWCDVGSCVKISDQSPHEWKKL